MELLKKIDEQPGLTIREVIDPFLESRSRRALYYKILTLAAHGFVRLDRKTMSRKVLCYPTAETRKCLVRLGNISMPRRVRLYDGCRFRA